MADKLVVMEKGDLKRKAEDVGDWDTTPFDPWITNKKTLQRIRFYYCRSHPCQEIPDGLERRSTNHLRVYQCPQFSMKSVGKRRNGIGFVAMSSCSSGGREGGNCNSFVVPETQLDKNRNRWPR
jgi:hypothetical protein